MYSRMNGSRKTRFRRMRTALLLTGLSQKRARTRRPAYQDCKTDGAVGIELQHIATTELHTYVAHDSTVQYLITLALLINVWKERESSGKLHIRKPLVGFGNVLRYATLRSYAFLSHVCETLEKAVVRKKNHITIVRCLSPSFPYCTCEVGWGGFLPVGFGK